MAQRQSASRAEVNPFVDLAGVEVAPRLEEIAAEALRRAVRAGLDPREFAVVAMACVSIPGDAGLAGE